jgi:single-strand DNA-binding protein
MPSFNRVILMGNLTRDPEMRVLPVSNTPVVNIGVAVNRRWRNQQGEQQDEVTFVDCEAFGKTAEMINQYFRKGNPILVEGRLKLDQWQDKEGNNRSKLKVVAENFQFVDSKADRAGAGGSDDDQGGGSSAPRTYTPRGNAPAAGGNRAPAARPPASQPPVGGGDPHTPVSEEDIPF